MEGINLIHGDSLQALKGYADNHFDIAIVDPPYGIDINSSGTHFKEKYEVKDWDKNTPDDEYFTELKRVSKNQIIWGGNYFLDRLGNCKCFIVWDKKIAEDMSFAMCEMAWTSFKNGAKIYKTTAMQQNRIHPTQKPVSLYKWLLETYTNENDLILDTHLGSGSIALALDTVNKFEKMNLTLTACEIDPKAYEKTIKRIEHETRQESLF